MMTDDVIELKDLDGRRCCRVKNPAHLCGRCAEVHAALQRALPAALAAAAEDREVEHEIEQARDLLAATIAELTPAQQFRVAVAELNGWAAITTAPSEPPDPWERALEARRSGRATIRTDAITTAAGEIPDPWEAQLRERRRALTTVTTEKE